MSLLGRHGWRSIAAISAVLAVALPALTVGTASAGPLPASGSSPVQLWAYGAYRTVNLSGTGHDLHGPYGYSLRAYYGIQVILNQSNLTNSTRTLELQRTLGVTSYWTYCRPSCTAPLVSLNLTVKALELGVGFANLTSAGTVYQNGSAVPAVALIDSFAEVHASLGVDATASLHTLGGVRTSTLDAIATANASVGIAFAPPLGLYPVNLTPGTHWNSTSAFTSNGAWSVAGYWSATNFTGATTSGGNSTTGSASASGNVSLSGEDEGPLTLVDGSIVHALSLSLEGPFAVREGLLFVPADADLFASSSSAPNGPPQASESAGTTLVDMGAGAVPHFGPASSFSTLASASQGSSLAVSTMGSVQPQVQPAGSQLPAATGLSDSSGPVTLQAQPEPVTSAQQMSNCLSSGDCPIPGASTPFKGTGIVILLVGLVVVSAVVLVVARRRQSPPPARPLANLYPAPGSRGPPAPPVPAGARGAPPPPEPEDPLGHLW